MTLEQKAKAYDEAKARMSKAYNSNRCTIGFMNEIFPELKESEDEKKTQESLMQYLWDMYHKEFYPPRPSMDDCDKWLAWLEKQGQTFTKKDVDDAYLKGVTNTKNEIEKQYVATYQIRKDIATFIFNYRGDIKDRAKWMDYLGIKAYFVEKQGEQNLNMAKSPQLGEQKSVDKIESFHEGDWVVYHGWTTRILKVTHDGYVNNKQGFIPKEREDCVRLWDITKDAKDGDVLAEDSCIFIIEKLNSNGTAIVHCCLFDDGEFNLTSSNLGFDVDSTHPATKEQRTILFQKMKEAGYEWDAEKKELKEIENEIEIPFGAKDSELQEATYYIPQGFYAEIDDDKVVIKKGEKPIAWSEEDEKIYSRICYLIHSAAFENYDVDEVGKELGEYAKITDWLKAIKTRCAWKPSEEQIEALKEACNEHWEPDGLDLLYTLYQELKKLKRE